MTALLLICALLVQIASAEATNALRASENSMIQKDKSWMVSLSILASSTLQKSEADGRDANLLFQLVPSYQFNKVYKISVGLNLNQSLSVGTKTTPGNTAVTLNHSPSQLTESSSLFVKVGGKLPTNPDDHRDNTFNGATFATIQLISDFDLKLPMSVMIGLSATKNFHTYDYNNLGQANISYVFQPSVGLDIALTKNIKFNLNGDWTRAQTYQEVEKSQFSIAESIEYEEPSWRIAIGHSNSGDVHQYNGREYTVKAFDENTSVIFTSLAATF